MSQILNLLQFSSLSPSCHSEKWWSKIWLQVAKWVPHWCIKFHLQTRIWYRLCNILHKGLPDEKRRVFSFGLQRWPLPYCEESRANSAIYSASDYIRRKLMDCISRLSSFGYVHKLRPFFSLSLSLCVDGIFFLLFSLFAIEAFFHHSILCVENLFSNYVNHYGLSSCDDVREVVVVVIL